MQLDSSSADNLRFDLRAYERLAELLPRLLAEDAAEPLIAAIADAVEELIPCSAVLLFESRETDGALMPILMRGLSRGAGREPIHPDGDSLEAMAIASTEPVLSRRSTATGGETIASIPLVVRGRATGCLTVHRRIDQVFLDEELRFLARLADVAAMSLDNVQARAKLAELAQTDELTGLLNRRGFFAAFDRILAQGARDGRCTSVLTVDVDDLKLVNDEFGHPAGDAVLVSVAQILPAGPGAATSSGGSAATSSRSCSQGRRPRRPGGSARSSSGNSPSRPSRRRRDGSGRRPAWERHRRSRGGLKARRSSPRRIETCI